MKIMELELPAVRPETEQGVLTEVMNKRLVYRDPVSTTPRHLRIL
jgi:hypothetical protein